MIISDLQFYDISWKYRFKSLSLRRTPKTKRGQSMTNPVKSRFCGIFYFSSRTPERHKKNRLNRVPLLNRYWKRTIDFSNDFYGKSLICRLLSSMCLLTTQLLIISLPLKVFTLGKEAKKGGIMSKSTFKILFYIRKNQVNKEGKSGIMLRLTIGKPSVRCFLKLKSILHWNFQQKATL